MILDALDRPHPQATLGTSWEFIADTVMGGVSSGRMTREDVAGRRALHLTGEVRVEGGGFVQMALDLAPGGGPVDLSDFEGLELDVLGNGETYNVHLRDASVTRPWQSHRASFVATPDWRRIALPFAAFRPHRIDADLEPASLRRLGLVAIAVGREEGFRADLALARLAAFPCDP